MLTTIQLYRLLRMGLPCNPLIQCHTALNGRNVVELPHSDNTRVELICDGVHVESSVIRATFKLFGDDRIILVSDSMMATGMENGQYTLGGQPVTVKGNKATFADGTLAGSVTNLMECMQKAISFGIPVESAVKSAAVNPAKEIGIYDQYGSISPGKYANLVLLDKEFNVKNVILKGKLIK